MFPGVVVHAAVVGVKIVNLKYEIALIIEREIVSFDADLQLLGRAIAMVIMINGCVLLIFGLCFNTKTTVKGLAHKV